jgi:hypothetical protein
MFVILCSRVIRTKGRFRIYVMAGRLTYSMAWSVSWGKDSDSVHYIICLYEHIPVPKNSPQFTYHLHSLFMHNLVCCCHFPCTHKPPNCSVPVKRVRNHCVRNCYLLYVSVHDVLCKEVLQSMRTVMMWSYVGLCEGRRAQISGAKSPRQVKFVWWLLNVWTFCAPLLQGCTQKFLNSPLGTRVQAL